VLVLAVDPQPERYVAPPGIVDEVAELLVGPPPPHPLDDLMLEAQLAREP